MQLIDGKKIAAQIKGEIALEVEKIKSKGGKIPHLAVIIVGEDPASQTYVNGKVKACKKVGFKSTKIELDSSITEEKLLTEIDKLNNNEDVDGFIVQLPLPEHISEQKVIEWVSPEKDVDGFHPVNLGKMTAGLPAFVSATPSGILELLQRYDIKTEGKHCVVIGRSNIVGRPVSVLMSKKDYPGNATVTLCHSRTKNLADITRQADIIIAALGKPHFLGGDMVKQGAVVIDVGTTRKKSDKTKSGWKLYGDVNFDQVAPKSSFITPVPGGVGPMTIVSLLKNTLLAAKKRAAK